MQFGFVRDQNAPSQNSLVQNDWAIMFDIKRVQNAGLRFQERCQGYGSATRAMESAVNAAPMSRSRQMLEKLTQEHAKRIVSEAEASGNRQDPLETVNQIGRERIIEGNDLTPLYYLELAVALARGVCKIRVGRNAGTGVLVAPNLIMTNHHVIIDEQEASTALAQFDFQTDHSGQPLPIHNFRIIPQDFFVTSKDLDFTIVAVRPLSEEGTAITRFPWSKLIDTPGKSEENDPINIIQHPNGGFKQIAIRNNNIISVPAGKPDFLYYTTDTEPGSSGSPCFNGQWEMVALHHQAVPSMDGEKILKLDGNEWVEGRDNPSLIRWIANEGVRVSAIVARLKEAQLTSAQAKLRDNMLQFDAPNPVEIAKPVENRGSARKREDEEAATPSEAPKLFAENYHGSVAIQIPLNITVSLGTPVPRQIDSRRAAPVATVSASPVAASQPSRHSAIDNSRVVSEREFMEVAVDPDWTKRKGYLEDFLGVKLPMPKLSKELEASTVQVPTKFRRPGNRFALNYYNYSVVMNADRCLAWYSAAMIDGDRRFVMPERDDKWDIDPRIDDDPANIKFQCGEELYAAKDTDRGHLTRYLDVAFGDSKEDAIRAAKDTFYFTNCALQLKGFNRSKSRWQGIEQFLLENKAKKEKRRIVVITGPIFRDDDPFYTNEFRFIDKLSARLSRRD